MLVNVSKSKQILELGTGLGYTAAFMSLHNEDIHIETIDRDEGHMGLARENWQELGVSDRIMDHLEKAEVILPTLTRQYDLIFFDGHVPSMKFLIQFERLLKKDGLLITANMFLRDKTGGKYMRALQKNNKWQIGVFADTAVALKLF
jgi:predicted O-methyltransferase YrrM